MDGLLPNSLDFVSPQLLKLRRWLVLARSPLWIGHEPATSEGLHCLVLECQTSNAMMPLMRRHFAIRFEPPANGHAVPLDVFVESITALAQGLSALKNGFSPHWAHRTNIKRAEADRQLAINLLPSEPGSFVQPFNVGSNNSQQEMVFHDAGATFVRYSGAQFSKFISDQPTTIFSVHVGECFLRAGEIARKKGIGLAISERRQVPSGTAWRPIIPLTNKLPELQKSLSVRKERAPRPITTQLIGQVDSLSTNPLFMMLRAKGAEAVRISLTNDIKSSAHELWGKQALVTIVGRESDDGRIVDATAIRIRGLVTHDDPLEAYMSSQGTGKDIWASEPAQEYVKLLRGQE